MNHDQFVDVRGSAIIQSGGNVGYAMILKWHSLVSVFSIVSAR